MYNISLISAALSAITVASSSASLWWCQRKSYGVGYHGPSGPVADPHFCPDCDRDSLILGPLSLDGLFGPRFVEVLAHQQAVREDRSWLGRLGLLAGLLVADMSVSQHSITGCVENSGRLRSELCSDT